MQYTDIDTLLQRAHAAAPALVAMDECSRTQVLNDVADAIESHAGVILEANGRDLAAMDPASPLYDRLRLDRARLRDIASDMRHVSSLPSPLGIVTDANTLPNGLYIRRVSVPFGVIAVIYEARPNVTFDVFGLCFKSGNACVLKGGKDAANTNVAAVSAIHDVLRCHGIDTAVVAMPEPTHEATRRLLEARGLVDLCIPRGGRRLIDTVRQNAKVPVIETGAGVVHVYIDAAADTAVASAIVVNAKTRRVSVCNALDTTIVHASRLGDIAQICAPLADKSVTIYADTPAYGALLEGGYPVSLLAHADDDDSASVWDTEWMDYKMGLRTVDSLERALAHIAAHGSGHSEAIVTEDAEAAEIFRRNVDAACVYVNAPTSFTDGAQFGLGAEIGISTQKLGPRGPMGLREITTYRWYIDGHGQTRP